MTTLLDLILGKLNRAGAPDKQWPDHSGEYWALCPFHADTHAGNFSVSVKGFKCFSCGESGGLGALAEKLGIVQPETAVTSMPADLPTYASAKRLPADFLASLGLQTVYTGGQPCIRIPYYDPDGTETGARLRVSMTSKNRFKWRKGSKLAPYGLWLLAGWQQLGYVILVEGESDAQTLWHYDIPALGIPGASTWRAEWADHLEGLTVFVWQEPDAAGGGFAERVGESAPDCLVITPPAGRKDISECHILGEDVPAVIDALRRSARPYREIRAERLSEEAATARQQAGALLASDDILGEVARLCAEMGLVGEHKAAQLLYLAITSRLLDKPVSVAVKGPSSGGKSFTVETVVKTFPPAAVYALSSMSERALAYGTEPLQHRFLVLYEAAGMASDFGSYLVRTLLSEGCIRYETVEKTADGLKPKLIEREGPTGLILTTTKVSIHPENETRHLSVTVRDDRDQTRGVFHSLADRANGRGPATVNLEPWHGLQTWLQLAGSRAVTIPFAHELATGADARAVRLRRDFGQILKLIAAHAILHQTRRQRDGYGRIVATPADYKAVYDLVIDAVSEGVQATVNPRIRETIAAVKALLSEATDKEAASVTLAQLAERLDLDKSAASRRTKVAEGLGYLVNLEDRKGKPARYVMGDGLPDEKPVLPSPDSLAGGEGGSIPPKNTATVQHSPAGEGEGGHIPPCNTATVQHSPNGRPTETIDGVLVDYDAFSDLLWEGFSKQEAVQRSRMDAIEVQR